MLNRGSFFILISLDMCCPILSIYTKVWQKKKTENKPVGRWTAVNGDANASTIFAVWVAAREPNRDRQKPGSDAVLSDGPAKQNASVAAAV